MSEFSEDGCCGSRVRFVHQPPEVRIVCRQPVELESNPMRGRIFGHREHGIRVPSARKFLRHDHDNKGCFREVISVNVDYFPARICPYQRSKTM